MKNGVPWASSLIALFAAVAFGCGMDQIDGYDATAEDTRSGLSVAVQGLATSSARMRIGVERCAGGEVESTEASLEAAKMPGGIDTFEGGPYGAASEHHFADHYFTLEAGCYRASARPIDAGGQPLETCSVARSSELQVKDGETTEVMLIAQCEGARRGGIDVMGTINHPPRAQAAIYRPSKEVTCPQATTICVESTDPDGDPMRGAWTIAGGPTPRVALHETVTRLVDGTLRQCAKLTPSPGLTTVEYTVWDRLHHEGQLIDFDEYFRREGRSERSHDKVEFPVFSKPGRCSMADAGIGNDTGDAGTFVDAGGDTDDDGSSSGDVDGGDARDAPDASVDGGTDAGGCDCQSAVTVAHYDVERGGQRVQTSSLSSVGAGDRVTAHFTVDPACSAVEVSLVSYEASGSSFQTSLPQTLYDSATGTFGPGGHSIGSVGIPACYFQTELVCGRVLTGAELGSGDRYGARKIDWKNGGARACTRPSNNSSCTRTRGYWSNHHEFASNPSQRMDWPKPEDEHATICGRTWLETVELTASGGAVWRILAPQWIAAKLNAAANGTVPVSVANTISRTERLLETNCDGIGSSERARALSLKDVLDAYNNGEFGSASCGP